MTIENQPAIAVNGEKSEDSISADSVAKPQSNAVYFPLDYDPKAMQEIVKEAILLAGGAAAILLQVANPGVGAGVNEHSNFAYRPVDRLRTTMTYVYTISFGTEHERKAIIEMTNKAHSTVKGRGYYADDPELQLWVAATLYAAGVDIYEKIMGPVPPSKAEKIYQEYSVLATALRVPPGMWPADRRAFWAYWDRMIESFEITDHAKQVANDLLYPKKGPLWMKGGMPFVRILTAEWLPPRLREAYGLKSTKSTRAMYKFLMGVTKGLYPHLPRKIRTFPMRYYMKDMRKRLANQV
ncbi:hypothetical protein VTO42DRAFT_1711 [Malbranchea cinnamomea]